jgi:hypothetical protein
VGRANDAKRYEEVADSLPSVVLLVLKGLRPAEHMQLPLSLYRLAYLDGLQVVGDLLCCRRLSEI